MKKIEKKIKNEINSMATPDFSRVAKECCISVDNKVRIKKTALASGREREERQSFSVKNGIIFALVMVLLVSLIIVSFKIINKDEDPFANGGHFIIDINPSIEISYDEDGNVTSISPLNEDAEVLLYGVELTGVHYEQVVTTIIDNCIELGYISADRADNAIMTTAVNPEGVKNEKMTEIIKNAFTKEFSNRKILGVVITGVENPELREEAEKYGVDGQKLALIKNYISKGGQLAEDEYSNVSIRELYFGIYNLEKAEKNNTLEKVKEDAKVKTDELNVQLKSFVESLKVVLSLEDQYLEYLNRIESIQSRLENSTDPVDVEKLVNEILSISNELKSVDITMLVSVSALEEVLLPYIDSFNEKKNELKELDKPIEEKRNERAEQFKDSVKTEIEHNVENWQNKLEEEFSKNWFEYKDEWGEINTQKDKHKDTFENKPEDKPHLNEDIESPQEPIDRHNGAN